MNNSEKIALINYLQEFTTTERVEKIDYTGQLRTRHITIALENIFQSQNASAVLRSAECLGVQDIHVIENDNPFEVHTDIALGSSKWLTIHRYNETENNTVNAIHQLKANGYRVIATMPHESECMLEEMDLSEPVAFLFGTELTGLSEEAVKHADGFVKIPMYGFTESFNISVSAALVMQNTMSKLRKSDINWSLSEEEQLDLKIEWLKKSLKTPDMIVARYFENLKKG